LGFEANEGVEKSKDFARTGNQTMDGSPKPSTLSIKVSLRPTPFWVCQQRVFAVSHSATKTATNEVAV